jgi:alpha-beta hydrolase superfamily lysophospholipase
MVILAQVRTACLLLLLFGAATSASAEVIPVGNGAGGDVPTQTLYWEGSDAKATLVLIPGGAGHLGLKATQNDPRHYFYRALKKLTDTMTGNPGIHVVLFDSPHPLDLGPRGYPSSRATADHLSRISSVIRFYKQKTGKPVWLMGHSNGAVSITEFLRYNDPERAPSQISGLIVSGARKVAYFGERPVDVPVLFLHHEKDGCANADPRASVQNFEQVKKANKSVTEFRFLKTGEPESGSPCASGYHMYYGADIEMNEALRNFILSNSP